MTLRLLLRWRCCGQGAQQKLLLHSVLALLHAVLV
jgi:hypothetical protein